MLSCWSKGPLERPSFSDIVCHFEKLCDFPNEVQEVSLANQYIKLQTKVLLYIFEITNITRHQKNG